MTNPGGADSPVRHPTVAYERYHPALPPGDVARGFYETLAKRRTVREYSSEPVPFEVIEWVIRAAGSAPSGANKQPWRFVVVGDPETKRKIRAAAEAEEREFYSRRASAEWLADLAPLGTDEHKEFLEAAPWVIVVFKLMQTDDGKQVYYANESVGIAVGMLLAAAQFAGLATLTHTPSPMGFLSQALGRPAHERAYVVIPIGYSAEGCRVPDIRRKDLSEILVKIGDPVPARR
ncbi:MAG: nitroreductase family protein [Phycisphaerales bacterium]|jgi:nitroreductase